MLNLIELHLGHSQGILSALIFAASKTEKELIENIISSVEYLFWIGVRLQQAVTFPSFIEAQRTDILKESKKIHGSRNPTPMMVVLHLLPQVVQKYVDIINKKLSDEPNRRLEIAIQVLRRWPMASLNESSSTYSYARHSRTVLVRLS